jgi:hypothetical protein
MHSLLKNRLAPAAAARSVAVRVESARGQIAQPGTEVRLYRAGTRTLLGTRLLDTGSGYDAQSVGLLHFGIPDGVTAVDIETTGVARGRRATTTKRVALADQGPRPVSVQMPR